MNEDRTRNGGGSNLTQANHGSFPARYELIDKDGRAVLNHTDVGALVATAEQLWPGEPQDPERTGKGWDVQVVRP